MLALALGLISNASLATDERRASITQNFYNLELWDNHAYGNKIKTILANTYAAQKFGSEIVNNSKWITDEIKHAWTQGHTGEGVSINVVDNHRKYTRTRASHGASVKAVAGGKINIRGTKTIGIAPDADVTRTHMAGNTIFRSNTYDYDIVNFSFVSDHGIDVATHRPTNYFRNVQTDALIVKGAGNRENNCKLDGKCSAYNLELTSNHLSDQTLIVGAVHSKTGNRYGTKAGILKDNFVVDDSFYTINANNWIGGTSSATPTVAGKAAIIKSKFPNLNGAGLANLIKTTADDLGAPGVDEIYGHGKVNLTRALSPVGTIR